MSEPPGARSPVTAPAGRSAAFGLVPAAGADPSVSRSATLQGGLGAAALLGQGARCQPASPEHNDALEEPSL